MTDILDRITLVTLIAIVISVIGFAAAIAGAIAGLFVAVLSVLFLPSIFPPKPRKQEEKNEEST